MSNKRSANIHRGRHVIRFYSKKSGCALQIESFLEWILALRLEVNPDVKSFAAQPESMHLEILGKKCRFTPDFLVKFINGRESYIEIHHAKFTNDEYKKKVASFNEYTLGTTGLGIELIVSEDVDEIELHNLKLLAANYLLEPSFQHEQYSLPDTISFSELIAELKVLTKYPVSEAYTLLTSGVYEFNEAELISANSILQRVGA
ncbi:hypothetical protein Q4601_20850 [Shewanella sp. 1_MG-2023]|uniref:TnsA endonuclease N-terminal domain-containing protein n=1 Tax=unclassified Shewanella TaxID=196818 RepID=UPI0026E216A6|nr:MULTISPECIES: TnsA endonuclease N-terminal domain-containing protein [unclassified Shewanella]MDO6613719.1 hypothetical protein [Shewanella sp. 7_MG-2023]MDO6773686.1 hypothetical protein [Shewanella sp. 2_MG-2023]MDO6796745.1 hypothetical protein [Shewanella sp. 1_MG-2023]